MFFSAIVQRLYFNLSHTLANGESERLARSLEEVKAGLEEDFDIRVKRQARDYESEQVTRINRLENKILALESDAEMGSLVKNLIRVIKEV